MFFRVPSARQRWQFVRGLTTIDAGGTHCADRPRGTRSALRGRAAGNHAVEDFLLSQRSGRDQLERRVPLRLYGGRGNPYLNGRIDQFASSLITPRSHIAYAPTVKRFRFQWPRPPPIGPPAAPPAAP